MHPISSYKYPAIYESQAVVLFNGMRCVISFSPTYFIAGRPVLAVKTSAHSSAEVQLDPSSHDLRLGRER